MATTLARSPGTTHCFSVFLPQAATRPFCSKARPCELPREIATTPDKFETADTWEKPLFPQAITVLSLRSAAQKSPPTLKATALVRPGGTFVCWKLLLPQTTIVPSAHRAPESLTRAEMAMTLVNPAGTLVAPERPEPQLATVPSGLNPNPWLSPAAMATAFVNARGNAS